MSKRAPDVRLRIYSAALSLPTRLRNASGETATGLGGLGLLGLQQEAEGAGGRVDYST
jgi:hypothetical protein